MNNYGCHSDNAKNKFKSDTVEHSKGNVKWAYVFTKTCQYDKREFDGKCNDCKHEAKQ